MHWKAPKAGAPAARRCNAPGVPAGCNDSAGVMANSGGANVVGPSEWRLVGRTPPAGDGATNDGKAGGDDQRQQCEGADRLRHNHRRADAGQHLYHVQADHCSR